MFRKEAIKTTRQKLHGNVFLLQPLSFLALNSLLVTIAITSVLFLLCGSYVRSEKVIGYLVPSKGLVKIQIPRNGNLESIAVQENEQVKAGQILATIQSSGRGRDGTPVTNEILAALHKQESELKIQLLLEEEYSESESRQFYSEKEDLLLNIVSLREQLILQEKIADSSRQTYSVTQKLQHRGFINKGKLESDRQQWLRQLYELKVAQQSLHAAESRLKMMKLRLQRSDIGSKQRIARLAAQIAEIETDKADVSARGAEVITALVDGRVISISRNVRGRSVQTGEPLLTILPEGTTLLAEMYLPSRAIGFVEKGQEVRLLYDAFPYQFFGSHRGFIKDITATILSPSEVSAPFNLTEPVYRVLAELEKQSIGVAGKVINLQSGMTLKAYILLERRSFFDWVLEPLSAVRNRS